MFSLLSLHNIFLCIYSLRRTPCTFSFHLLFFLSIFATDRLQRVGHWRIMWHNTVRRFPKGRTLLKTYRPFVVPPLRFSPSGPSSIPLSQFHKFPRFHTTVPSLRAAMTYYNTGKYDRTVQVRPDQFPILCSPLYDGHDDGCDWDSTQDMMEKVVILHRIIQNDDVPALREMLRLVGPELLYWDQDYHQMSPTMILAAEMGRVRILEALLDYRDTLTAAQHDLVKEAYERLERESGSDIARCWGTPLTTACMCHVSTSCGCCCRACPRSTSTPATSLVTHRCRPWPDIRSGHHPWT